MHFLSKNTHNILLMESYKCSHRRCYFAPQQRLGVALLFWKICSFINDITLSVGSCIRKANKIMRGKKKIITCPWLWYLGKKALLYRCWRSTWITWGGIFHKPVLLHCIKWLDRLLFCVVLRKSVTKVSVCLLNVLVFKLFVVMFELYLLTTWTAFCITSYLPW